MGIVLNGIDVSKWQGQIEWKKVKETGIDFAIIRCGFGKDGVDKMFEQNYANAKEAGVNIGAYLYSYADNIEDAKREADYTLKLIKGKSFEFPICFDMEDRTQLALNNQMRTNICAAWCEEIEKAKGYAMIYVNWYWFGNKINGAVLFKKYDLWISRYGVIKPTIQCGLWQKSDTGDFYAIAGNIDLNEAYKDYPTVIKNKGLNKF